MGKRGVKNLFFHCPDPAGQAGLGSSWLVVSFCFGVRLAFVVICLPSVGSLVRDCEEQMQGECHVSEYGAPFFLLTFLWLIPITSSESDRCRRQGCASEFPRLARAEDE